MAFVNSSLSSPASGAKIRGELYKLRNEQGGRRPSSRTRVRSNEAPL
jgi:hypothetical protein